MKKISKLLVLVLALSACFALLAACVGDNGDPGDHTHAWVNGKCTICDEDYELVDYVGTLKLTMDSDTKKYTSANILKQFVDGDTTHFNVPGFDNNTLKARYLAVNTPESTGKIQPYGKVASNFTHNTLQDAIDNGGSILVESDTDEWETDNYGRTLAWVWYKPDANSDYRNLNLELLQRGLGLGSNASDNRYGKECEAALGQAIDARLIVHSGLKDETFYYDGPQETDIKEIRTHLEDYEDTKVAFEGTVTLQYNGGSYVEDLDGETGLVFGMYIYWGTEKTPQVTEILGVNGNRVRVVGTLTCYNGSWQVSGVQYKLSKPNDPDNLQLVDNEKHDAYYQELTAAQFNGKTTIKYVDEELDEEISNVFDTKMLVNNSTVSMSGLTVYRTSTTTNESSSNYGAFTLYCRDSLGNEVVVRTIPLYDADGELVKASDYMNQEISIKGVVDYYSEGNQYQIMILSLAYLTII